MVQGRASGGGVASVRGHPLPPVTHPSSVQGRPRRALPIRNMAASCCALLTRAGPDHELIGPVPLCSGGERAAAVKYDMYDRCYTPRIPRMPVRERGRFGRVPAAAVTREGRPTASPAVSRPPAIHPDGAGPRGMLLQCVYSFKARCARKVFESERLQCKCICNKPES